MGILHWIKLNESKPIDAFLLNLGLWNSSFAKLIERINTYDATLKDHDRK